MKSFSTTVRPAPARPRTVDNWLGGPNITIIITNTVITWTLIRTTVRSVARCLFSRVRRATLRTVVRISVQVMTVLVILIVIFGHHLDADSDHCSKRCALLVFQGETGEKAVH